MPLTSGTKLGRYEVRSALGAGGMGEVYVARDTSLQRDVALKVLPAEFANDSSRLRRFQQEALATAALNHPHIVGIFDAGTHDGVAYAVSELLEGRTLRDALDAGALPTRTTVQYAAQLAAGLAAAHDKGIVHRDLKPENLFVTADGRLKILDFGIARILDGSPLAGGATGTAVTATMPGSVIGTVGYMAPEQVRGEAIDHRADIFAFGTVLYEMLTRRRAFKRDTVPQTLSAILSDDLPEWTGETTPLFNRALRIAQRCTDKSPASRFQSARDLSLLLSDESSDASAVVSPASKRSSRWPILVAAGVLCASAGAALATIARPVREVMTTSTSPVTFELIPPSGVERLLTVAISRDGRQLAAVGRIASESRVYVRGLHDLSWREIKGSAAVREAFFSPDGVNLAFYTETDLKRVPVAGDAAPIEICKCAPIRGGTWGDDDRIVFGVRGGGLMRVAAGGGAAELIATPANSEEFRYPVVLPGAKAVIFTAQTSTFETRLMARRLDDNAAELITLAADGRGAQLIGKELAYINTRGELFVQPFDVDALRFTGPATAMPERPVGGVNTSDVLFRASSTGIAIYTRVEATVRPREMVSVSPAGVSTLVLPADNYDMPRISPAGDRVVFTKREGIQSFNLFVHDLIGHVTTRLTSDGNSRQARWLPDNKTVVFAARGGGAEAIATIEVDASGNPIGARRLLTSEGTSSPVEAVEQTLLYGSDKNNSAKNKFGWDIWTMPLDKPTDARVLIAREGEQYGGSVSRDRRFIAYSSNEGSKPFGVFVTTYPIASQIWTIAANSVGPTWSRQNDDELFFARNNGTTAELWSVRFTATGPSATPPGKLALPAFAAADPGVPNYDVTPDGRFVMLKDVPQPENLLLPIVIVNWRVR